MVRSDDAMGPARPAADTPAPQVPTTAPISGAAVSDEAPQAPAITLGADGAPTAADAVPANPSVAPGAADAPTAAPANPPPTPTAADAPTAAPANPSGAPGAPGLGSGAAARRARRRRALIVGLAAVLLVAALVPRGAPVPTVSGIYGSAIGMDSLSNTDVGGPASTSTSYRFRAETTAELSSIRIYVVGPTHEGYGAGTGGTWRITVQTDDGTSSHAPSGTILATMTYRPVDGLQAIAWSPPARLTAGQLYHVVFENQDPNPTANFASVDGVFMAEPTEPRQPAFSDVDWGQPTRSGSETWADQAATVPIMELTYANGVTGGLGYMEVWVRSYRSISGDAKARESFTVSGPNRAVGAVSIRLMRISGSSPLSVRLETSGGALIEEGMIPASEIAVGKPGDHLGNGHATWETFDFVTPHALASGHGYNVVVSTAADTVYSVFVIRKGSTYDFSPATYFGDGHAQYATGSAWGPFVQDGGPALDQADLQFYFH